VASPGGLASSIVTRTRPTRRVTQSFGFRSGHTCGIAELSRFLAEIGGGLANDPRVGTRVLSGEGSRGGTGQQMFTAASVRSMRQRGQRWLRPWNKSAASSVILNEQRQRRHFATG